MINVFNNYGKIEFDYEKIVNDVWQGVKKLHNLDDDTDISLILVNSEEIHEMNKQYRDIDRPTDVISFALKDSEDSFFLDELDLELGDIFINYEAVINQAKEYGHSECREISFLCTHGLLHLLGYDHMNEEDEKEMFGLQDVILDGFTF